ncbi:hypothetical protein [Streptomyces sp. WAC06273]|uniref:hypothetical protein n=1 Tax=Streptomyces sp. WAC06273 TaxID=2487422 RepID=UPI0037DC9C95
MANKKGRRRRFCAVRQYRSGRWTASYLGPDGERMHADETFATRKDAEIWLSQVEADLSRGDWRAPDAGAVNFRVYAEKWVEGTGAGRSDRGSVPAPAEPVHPPGVVGGGRRIATVAQVDALADAIGSRWFVAFHRVQRRATQLEE